MAALKQWKTRLNSLLGRTLVKRSIRLAGKRPVASMTFDAAIRQVVRSNGWLILITHDVSEAPSHFGSTPGMLDWALARVAAAKIDALPVREALPLALGF